jgi:abhydrolase domain-containing protein 12
LNDLDIPYTHSEVLFNAFLKPHLPSIPLLPTTLPIPTDAWNQFETHRQAHFAKRKEIVTHIDMGNFGTVDEFEQEGRKIILVKTEAGKHDFIGVQEGLQDIIGMSFGFF